MFIYYYYYALVVSFLLYNCLSRRAHDDFAVTSTSRRRLEYKYTFFSIVYMYICATHIMPIIHNISLTHIHSRDLSRVYYYTYKVYMYKRQNYIIIMLVDHAAREKLNVHTLIYTV